MRVVICNLKFIEPSWGQIGIGCKVAHICFSSIIFRDWSFDKEMNVLGDSKLVAYLLIKNLLYNLKLNVFFSHYSNFNF
jgi:hypothetical protein